MSSTGSGDRLRRRRGAIAAAWLRRLSIVGLLLACACAAAAGVQPHYRVGVHVFTGEDGLPQSGVNAVLQTGDGYLWLGTFGGLARFDGQAFTLFRAEPTTDSPAAPDGRRAAHAGPASDRILALFEDDSRQLWIGTHDAGLNVYRQGAFQHLPVCGGRCQINAIFQAPGRRLWVLSNVGMFSLDRFGRQPRWIDSARTGHTLLARDRRGRVYVGGGEGLFVMDGDRLAPIPLPAGDGWVQVLQASGEELLVGTNRALYRYSPDRQRWQPLEVDAPTAAVQDADGRWWVAAARGRVLRQDEAGGWREIPELFGIGVVSLARDDEGNLWLGSGSKGLYRVRKPLFGLLAAPRDGVNMAGRVIVGDGQGGLWLGSACAGLRHWRRDGDMRLVPLQARVGDDCVTSLTLDRDGAPLAGTADGRLVRVAQGKPTLLGRWPGVGAVDVWNYGDRGFLLAAGATSYEIELDGEGRIASQRRIDALQGMNLNGLLPAARGGYWAVGDRGVWRLAGGRIVERWTPQQGLSSRFARALYEDPATGTLWVGTYGGGLNRIRHGRVQRYDSRNGLFDDTVSCILPDGQGRLWLGGNRGVAVLPAPDAAADAIESVGYSAADGLIPAEINGGHSASCHRDTQGRLWFSLVEGFAVIDAAGLSGAKPGMPRPHIEQVAVGGRARDRAASPLAIEPFARNLEIHYTAINLSRPRDTRFRLRLLGFDHDWVDAGLNRSIVYSTIPWGEHVFEVQARSQGGDWSPVSARLEISNPQPWYLRPWILILTTALGLVVLVGATQLGANQEREVVRRER